MRITDMFTAGRGPVFSFEFFPPKTEEGRRSLQATIARLVNLEPGFVSVTYGAGGSTRDRTIALVSDIKNRLGIETMAHLTCVGTSQAELGRILDQLESEGIENVIALRGDPPQSGEQLVPPANGFEHAIDLVRLIRTRQRPPCVAVAGYPEGHVEAASKETDLRFLADKVRVGADIVITQLFFDNRHYFDFVDRTKQIGIDVPIVPGIMPITNLAQIERFTTMCGASIPTTLRRSLAQVQDDPREIIRLGVAHATNQCLELLEAGAPGIHFYTLNKSRSTYEILGRIRNR